MSHFQKKEKFMIIISIYRIENFAPGVKCMRNSKLIKNLVIMKLLFQQMIQQEIFL
jgi:hypothetical protein